MNDEVKEVIELIRVKLSDPLALRLLFTRAKSTRKTRLRDAWLAVYFMIPQDIRDELANEIRNEGVPGE